MAYADKGTSANRGMVVGAVAAIHGAAIYALVTGLGATYVQEIIPVLTGRNIPIEPQPEPEPVPEPEKARTDSERVVTAPQPDIVVPRGDRRILELRDVPLPPLPPGHVLELDPPVPPRDPAPSYPPTRAAPRNDPSTWATTGDYPARDLREGNQGRTHFRVTVGPDGRVQNCEIVGSSGFAGLDAATCKHVSRRARFDPATDATGARVGGTYTSAIHWIIPD